MADDVVGFPLSDRPCALCGVLTVMRVCILSPGIMSGCPVCASSHASGEFTYRVPCCDGCSANLTEDKRMRLLEAACREQVKGD